MVAVNKRNSEIWAIGGGKGGVGKSFVISSIGTYLALKGRRVVLIDADFGGANLHTFLGVNRPKNSLTDFFEKKMSLEDIIVDSGIENMGLLTGAIHSLAPDSIKHFQKLKFFRHIKSLDADYVLIDLGVGTHFNNLDTFLIADKLLIVIVPEIIAIENFYYFLNNVFYRNLGNSLAGYGLKNVVQDTWKNRYSYGIENLNQLIEYLKKSSEEIDSAVTSELSRFKVYLVLNKVRSSDEIKIGNSVKSICMKYLGFSAQYVGYVEFDDFISRAINTRQPYMKAFPTSRCAKEIEGLTENLLEGRSVKTMVSV